MTLITFIAMAVKISAHALAHGWTLTVAYPRLRRPIEPTWEVKRSMTHDERVEAALDMMLAQESPAETPELVDILSGSDNEEVAFTGIWFTNA